MESQRKPDLYKPDPAKHPFDNPKSLSYRARVVAGYAPTSTELVELLLQEARVLTPEELDTLRIGLDNLEPAPARLT